VYTVTVEAGAQSNQCPYTTVLTAWGGGSDSSIYADAENFGGPETQEVAVWGYPDGWITDFSTEPVNEELACDQLSTNVL
jgi:hypothetical protein